ncbi:WUSCHEL-related homeobox 1 [Spatholobus suberectus]|nr:WUSCHEL-related homeobox 1 [Spatholobus suberectus]
MIVQKCVCIYSVNLSGTRQSKEVPIRNSGTFHSSIPNSTHNSHADPKITTFCSIAQPYCICTHCNHILTFNPHVGHVAEEGTNNTGSHVQSQQSTREDVFYWFQNHKARERQKRRRREMEENAASSSEGLKETGCGVKETKKWASTSNCSGHAEESAAMDIAEKVSNGWTQFEERGTQVLGRNTAERQAKWQDMEMPCFPPITMAALTTAHRTHNTQLLTHQNYNLPSDLNRESLNYYDEGNADPRTLDLFPHKRDDQDGICLAERKSMLCASASMDTEITSNQFFEFLPLRN